MKDKLSTLLYTLYKSIFFKILDKSVHNEDGSITIPFNELSKMHYTAQVEFDGLLATEQHVWTDASHQVVQLLKRLGKMK